MEFDDAYPSCRDTHATVRIFSKTDDPSAISQLLSMQCTSSYLVGDRISSRSTRLRDTNAWFLRSKDSVDSLDCRRHLNWLCDQLSACHPQIRELVSRGANCDITCFWVSAIGQGGPSFSPGDFDKLSKLGLPLWFDIYSGTNDRG
ncbi:DUF4279 domain-containing protein [Rubripirellula obstinata]|uniref:DUF4279 domain-containing protein n=1 Tax=Rubripirellula obstinata TaxID=406547 RepID=UPI000A071218